MSQNNTMASRLAVKTAEVTFLHTLETEFHLPPRTGRASLETVEAAGSFSRSTIMNATFPITTSYEHIRLDDEGIPYIVGTTMKVVELVMAQEAYGWSPEELHFQHPYLSMSQIHSALAYYWEHKEELDADIEERLNFTEQSRQEAGASPLATRLRNAGLLE